MGELGFIRNQGWTGPSDRPGRVSCQEHHFLSQEHKYHYRDLYTKLSTNKDYSSKKVNDSYIRSCSCGKSNLYYFHYQ